MTTVSQVYDFLDQMAPFSTQMSFDNAGFLVGCGDQAVSKILVTLDITLPVIEEAEKTGAQLIVSHHPVIFHPARSVTDQDILGQKLYALVRADLSAICAHTNLDLAQGGVNDALADVLGLDNCVILRKEHETDSFGLGRIGTLTAPVEPAAFARLVRERLDSRSLRATLGNRPVSRVAVGGGSCGDLLYDAAHLGCDALVTGDVKYDQFLDAAALGVTLIDAGHFPTENVVCPVLQARLSAQFSGVEVVLSKVHREVCAACSELEETAFQA